MSEDRNNDRGDQGGFLHHMERVADKYYENVHDRIRDKMPGKEPLGNSSKPRSSQSSRGPSRDRRDRYDDDYGRRRSRRSSSEPDGHHGSASGAGSRVHWNSDDRQPGDDDSDSDDSEDSRRYRDERSRRWERRRSNSVEDSRSYVEEGRRRRSGESMGESTARGGYDATRIPSSQYAQQPGPVQPGYTPAEPNAYQQMPPKQPSPYPVPPPQQMGSQPPRNPSPYGPPPRANTIPPYGATTAGAYSNTSLPYQQQPPLQQQQVPPLQPQAGGSNPPPPTGPRATTPLPPRSPSPSRNQTKSSSRRDSKHQNHASKLASKDHHILASVGGALAGGFLGHQAGHGDAMATAAGAILGVLGMNLAEEQVMKRRDKIDKYKDKASGYMGGGGGSRRKGSEGGDGGSGRRRGSEAGDGGGSRRER